MEPSTEGSGGGRSRPRSRPPGLGPRIDPPGREPARKDPAHKDSPRRDPAHRDSPRKDPAHKEPARKDAAPKDPASKDAASKDAAPKDPARRTPAHRDPSRQDAGGADSGPIRMPGGTGSIGTGPIGTGPIRTGSPGTGPIGTGSIRAGSPSTGPLNTGPLGTGPIRAGSPGTGPIRAGSSGTGPIGTGSSSTGSPSTGSIGTGLTRAEARRARTGATGPLPIRSPGTPAAGTALPGSRVSGPRGRAVEARRAGRAIEAPPTTGSLPVLESRRAARAASTELALTGPQRVRAARKRRGLYRPGYWLLGLVALGIALRGFDLGKQSLWIDEGYTAYLAGLTPVKYVINVLHTVRNILPPLYFTLLHYWTAVFGFSEVSLRFPSLVFGVLLIPLLYRFVTRTYGPRVGLLAAGATTFSLFQIRYSQEARMYELLALLSVISLHLLTRVLGQSGRRQVILLAVTNALIVYTHHYGALLIVTEVVYVGILYAARDLDRKQLRRVLIAAGLFGGMVLPWALIFVNQLSKVNQYPWLPPVSLRSVYDVLVYFAGSPLCLLGLVILIGYGAYGYRDLPGRLRQRKGLTPRERQYLLLWLVFLLPILLAFGYSALAAPVFGQKYLIASSVAMLVLAALGAARVPARVPGRFPDVVALGLVLALASPQLYHYYHDISKEQWREATAYVEANAAPGDLVLFNAGYGLQDGFDAYAKRPDLVKLAFPPGSDQFATMPTRQQLSELPQLVAGHSNAWIVYSQSPDTSAQIAIALGKLSTGGACKTFVGVITCRYAMKRNLAAS